MGSRASISAVGGGGATAAGDFLDRFLVPLFLLVVFFAAETLDGVYRTLDFWSELFTQRRKVQSKNRKGLSEFFLCVFLCCFAPLREKNFVDSHYFFCYVAPNSKQQKERT